MLDVRGSRELQATILAVRNAQRDIRRDINKAARNRLNPVWRGELGARARTRLEQRVILSGARVAASDRGVSLRAAGSRRPLAGGLIPTYDWPAVELGASRKQATFTQRSRRGNRYQRTMRTGHGLPKRAQYGRIAYDAASVTGTRLVAMWVRTVVDEFRAVPGVEVEPV